MLSFLPTRVYNYLSVKIAAWGIKKLRFDGISNKFRNVLKYFLSEEYSRVYCTEIFGQAWKLKFAAEIITWKTYLLVAPRCFRSEIIMFQNSGLFSTRITRVKGSSSQFNKVSTEPESSLIIFVAVQWQANDHNFPFPSINHLTRISTNIIFKSILVERK